MFRRLNFIKDTLLAHVIINAWFRQTFLKHLWARSWGFTLKLYLNSLISVVTRI